jgi:hypothetical protein
MIIKMGKITIQLKRIHVFVDLSEPGASNIMGDIMADIAEGIKIIKKMILVIITAVFIFVS